MRKKLMNLEILKKYFYSSIHWNDCKNSKRFIVEFNQIDFSCTNGKLLLYKPLFIKIMSLIFAFKAQSYIVTINGGLLASNFSDLLALMFKLHYWLGT